MNKSTRQVIILFSLFSFLNYFIYLFIQSNYIDTILGDKQTLFLIMLFVIAIWFLTINITLKEKNLKNVLLIDIEKKHNKIEYLQKGLQKLSFEMIQNREKDKDFYEKSKFMSMNDLVNNIAHLWRQPLSVISVISTNIQLHEEIGKLDTKTISKDCEMINKNVQYLSKTIDSFSPSINKRRKELFKIDDLVCALYKQTNFLNIKIQNKTKDELSIFNHKNELIQVLLNIIKNSSEIFQKRKIKEKYIFINFEQKEDNLLINIKDTAGGIEDSILSKVFEPYFTTKEKALGVGLGLYIVNIIMSDIIRGKIEVTNEVFEYKNKNYKGAVFNIILSIK